MLSRCFVTAFVVLLAASICVADDSDQAKVLADKITGLSRLAGVSTEIESVNKLAEDDDTPIRIFKEHLLKGSLWKVSYKVDTLQHENKVSPHIVGFDVYVDISLGQVLKIVSRDAEGLAEKFRKGIEVSNREIRLIFKRNHYIENVLPTTAPTYKLVDFLMESGVMYRHYECYYTISDRHFPINEGIISGFTSQKIKPI